MTECVECVAHRDEGTSVPLLPAQAGFFLDVHHQLTNPSTFNLNVMLGLDKRTTGELVRVVAERTWRRHGALRARFHKGEGREWHQNIASAELHPPLRIIDLSALPASEQQAAVNACALQHQYSLDLNRGPLTQFLWFYYGEDRNSDLMVVLHHLVCDAYSLSVLREELTADFEAALAGGTVNRRPYSFADCAIAIDSYAGSSTVVDSLPTWLFELSRARAPAAIVGPDTYERDAASHVRHIPFNFAPDSVAQIVKPPFQPGLEPREVVLGLVADAVAKTFEGDVLFQVVVDGRTTRDGTGARIPLVPLEGLRAVGWFACESEVFAPFSAESLTVSEYNFVMAARNAPFPDGGLSFALLRHVSAVETVEAEVLLAHKGPQVWFNHISEPYSVRPAGDRADGAVHQSAHYFDFPLGPVVDPLFSGTPLAIEMRSGYSRLEGWLTYDTAYYQESVMRALADRISKGA